jgi:hypothetical protein
LLFTIKRKLDEIVAWHFSAQKHFFNKRFSFPNFSFYRSLQGSDVSILLLLLHQYLTRLPYVLVVLFAGYQQLRRFGGDRINKHAQNAVKVSWLMKWGQTHTDCFSSKVKTISQATVTKTCPVDDNAVDVSALH